MAARGVHLRDGRPPRAAHSVTESSTRRTEATTRSTSGTSLNRRSRPTLDLRDEKPSCDGDWSRDVVELPGVSGSDRDQAIAEAQQKFAPPSDAENVDLRSIYEAYEEALPGRGVAHLNENYKTITNLDTGLVNTRGYLRDFDLGDEVEMVISTVGLAEQSRIVGVTEVYEAGKVEISIEIGDELMTTVKKAKLA